MSQAGIANLGAIPPPPGSLTDVQGQDGVTVPPNGSGIIFVIGATAAAGTTPFTTSGNAGTSTETWTIQRSQAFASSDATRVGLASFNSAEFTVDANGFVSLAGGGLAVDSFAMQTGTSPVVPTGAGLVTFNGAVVAAGTNPVRTDGTGANTMALEVQISQAIAATNATNIGLAAFNSANFTVDANGFVSASGTGIGQTITGDSGGALSPTAGNWNILGRSGSKTAGTGSTLTVRSPPYADQGGSTTVTLNSGNFATAAITLTTPATAGLLDGDLLEFVATNGVLVIQLAATQVAHLGSAATSVAGTITGTATGDSLSLRYQASTNDWWATSSIGIWILA